MVTPIIYLVGLLKLLVGIALFFPKIKVNIARPE